MNHDYYLITGGPVLEAIQKYFEFRAGQIKLCNALIEEFGAQNVYGGATRVAGLVFNETDPPKGWILVKGQCRIYKPNERKPEGRELMKRFKAACVPCAQNFQEFVTGRDDVFQFMAPDLRVRFLGLDVIDDKYVLTYPTWEDLKNEDTRRWQVPAEGTQKLKTSEYWAMKENAEKSLANQK